MPLTIAILGCGSRGRTYAALIALFPDRYTLVAACDLVPERASAALKSSTSAKVFIDDKEFFAAGKLADMIIIATQDADHYAHAVAALKLSYDILLEKPAAQSLEECLQLDLLAKEKKCKIALCFVLRYTNFYRAIKSVIEQGTLGEIISIRASEGVEPYHQAHSFVRGHWADTKKSTPMIVAKCCHDMDLLCWFTGSSVKSVSSYGGLDYFNAKHAPAGATARCTDGCPHSGSCFYDAHRYLTDKRSWLRMVLDDAANATDQDILHFLKSSPWGRCVYKCDNDALDHQVIAAVMKNGVSISFQMTAFDVGRNIEIYGTKASLKGGHTWKTAGAPELMVIDHLTATPIPIYIPENSTDTYAGHGGGDYGLINELDQLLGSAGVLPYGMEGISGHELAFKSHLANL